MRLYSLNCCRRYRRRTRWPLGWRKQEQSSTSSVPRSQRPQPRLAAAHRQRTSGAPAGSRTGSCRRLAAPAAAADRTGNDRRDVIGGPSAETDGCATFDDRRPGSHVGLAYWAVRGPSHGFRYHRAVRRRRSRTISGLSAAARVSVDDVVNVAGVRHARHGCPVDAATRCSVRRPASAVAAALWRHFRRRRAVAAAVRGPAADVVVAPATSAGPRWWRVGPGQSSEVWRTSRRRR